ncbi:T9SS type A sorting domain-containing protein, partial [candidate division KSB1 bacterium]|nr:T9SS type A sorting domain-containing protein [candidate division KSB1 bacterium]
TAVTDVDGVYSIPQVPADAYDLYASATGFEDAAAPASNPVTVGDGCNVYSADLTLPDVSTDAAATAATPAEFALGQNYPNPFNPSTEIQFTLAAPARVHLQVFNLLGEEVKTLRNASLPAGTHTVSWDGTDHRGARMGSGVYFYRLEAVYGSERFLQMRRMLLIK